MKPGTLLKHQISIRTFAQWNDHGLIFWKPTWWPIVEAIHSRRNKGSCLHHTGQKAEFTLGAGTIFLSCEEKIMKEFDRDKIDAVTMALFYLNLHQPSQNRAWRVLSGKPSTVCICKASKARQEGLSGEYPCLFEFVSQIKDTHVKFLELE